MTSHACNRNQNGRRAVGAVTAAALILLTVAACHRDRHDDSSADPDLVLAAASVSVDGQSVDGKTLPQGHGEDGTAHFEAVLLDESGLRTEPAVWVKHHRPGAEMMSSSGMFQLYDDGTHGDPVPADGVYHYEDVDGQHGCHTAEAEPGEHHYEFYGMNRAGHESNHMTVTVTITE